MDALPFLDGWNCASLTRCFCHVRMLTSCPIWHVQIVPRNWNFKTTKRNAGCLIWHVQVVPIYVSCFLKRRLHAKYERLQSMRAKFNISLEIKNFKFLIQRLFFFRISVDKKKKLKCIFAVNDKDLKKARQTHFCRRQNMQQNMSYHLSIWSWCWSWKLKLNLWKIVRTAPRTAPWPARDPPQGQGWA